MYLHRYTVCMLMAVSTLRCQASGRPLIPNRPADSWTVSSAGPQDWPYCGDQCNPSGPDIFTDVAVPTTGALSWMISCEAHDQLGVGPGGGSCMSLMLNYTHVASKDTWAAVVGPVPHASDFTAMSYNSSGQGHLYNVTKGGTLRLTMAVCWGGGGHIRNTKAHFQVAPAQPPVGLPCFTAMVQSCEYARKMDQFNCGYCAGRSASKLESAGCPKAMVQAFCTNQTCAAQLDEVCADAKAAGEWQCGVCVGEHGQELSGCTAEKEKAWCSAHAADSLAAVERSALSGVLPAKTDDEPPRIWQPPPDEDEDALRREAAAKKYDPARLAANERGRKAWEEQQKRRRRDELAGKVKKRVKPPPPPVPSLVDLEKDEM